MSIACNQLIVMVVYSEHMYCMYVCNILMYGVDYYACITIHVRVHTLMHMHTLILNTSAHPCTHNHFIIHFICTYIHAHAYTFSAHFTPNLTVEDR